MTATASVPSGTVRKSTTASTLRRLRLGLLVATFAVLVASLLASQGIRGAADAVGTGTAPSIIEILAARAALVEADAAVIRSFETGEVRLAGPGVEYQNQIATASQSLARVAEKNLVGEAASQRIQLIQGLLVAYMGLVEQADAHYRQSGGNTLGLAYLWHASRLLHMPAGGILNQLDTLREDNERLLDEQVTAGWTSPATAAVWVVPLLILLVLLGVTLAFLSRRFRRALNVPLIVAAGLSLVLAAGASFSFVADHWLETARDGLEQARDDSRARTDAIVASGQEILRALVWDECARGGAACDEAVVDAYLLTRAADAGSPTGEAAGDTAGGQELTTGITGAAGQTTAAARAANAVLLAPLAAAAIAVMTLVGLKPRIDEYRYRSR